MSDEPEIKNAIITSARLTSDDHGLLSAWLMLDFGSSAQGFGGWALYLPRDFAHHKALIGHAGHFIWRCMEIGGVTEWSQLPGRTLRAKANWSKVHSIGHIVKDDWFDPAADFALVREATDAALGGRT